MSAVTAARRTPEAARPEAPDPRRWRALAVIQLAAFMVLLDVSIVNVALPSIQRELAMTRNSSSWHGTGSTSRLG